MYQDILDLLKNEAVLSTLISGAMGAFFGAVGAQLITALAERKSRVRKELNNINAAHIFSVSACNNYLSIKKQLVKPLFDRFYDDRNRILEWREEARGKEFGIVILCELDLKTMNPPEIDILQLQNIIFSNVALRGRGLSCLISLVNSNKMLIRAVEDRNKIIMDWRNNPEENSEINVNKYFGFINELGADETYKNYIDSVYKYLDDCIFFSHLLESDLAKYSKRLRRRNFISQIGIPRIGSVSWSSAEDASLIPEEQEYASWLKGFVIRPNIFVRLLELIKYRPCLVI